MASASPQPALSDLLAQISELEELDIFTASNVAAAAQFDTGLLRALAALYEEELAEVETRFEAESAAAEARTAILRERYRRERDEEESDVRGGRGPSGYVPYVEGEDKETYIERCLAEFDRSLEKPLREAAEIDPAVTHAKHLAETHVALVRAARIIAVERGLHGVGELGP